MPVKTRGNPPQRVTLQQIAKYCGVSKGTVSLALRGHSCVATDTALRVVSAAEALGYNPALHEAARRLAMFRKNERVINRVITLFFPSPLLNPHGGFFNELFRGVLEGARYSGFGLLVEYFTETMPLSPLFERSDVDAAIIFNAAHADVERLRGTQGFGNRPITALVFDIPGCSFVGTDESQAAYDITCALLAQGHRHLLQCVHPRREDEPAEPAARLVGIQQALREAGIDPAQHLHCFECDLEWINPATLPAGRRITQSPIPIDKTSRRLLAYLRMHPEVTAVLATNDACAFRVWQTLKAAGVAVPAAVSLVGFDDTDPVLDRDGVNCLSTVHVPLFEIGFQAAQLVIAQVTQSAIVTRLILAAEFVERRSTGAVPTIPHSADVDRVGQTV